jgi:lipopolysaccharide biosynthesis protein
MTNPTSFPPDGRRVIFYLIYDKRGNIDDYIPYKLEHLRPFAQHIVAIVNGGLSDQGREKLAPIVDEIWERANTGFDVGGYAMALDRFGAERLAEYDELILMNYTFFGPVRPFGAVFDRMNSLEVGFWGMTDHGPSDPHPVYLKGVMPSHIQSHWIAVRRSVFVTEEWRSYWRDMPAITTYEESILLHESRFTKHFEDLGHPYAVAFPHENYGPGVHPAFDSAIELLDDGCPVLKRRPFFHDPLYLDREAIIGRWLVESATSDGYPEQLIWQSMTRSASARVLYTNASMMEILPSQAIGYDDTKPLRVVVIMHVFYESMMDELLDRVATLPTEFDLVITTNTPEKAAAIERAVADRSDVMVARSEIRVVESNRGRDQGAFYVTCRDVLISGRYDLVVKIHSKRSVQDGARGIFFKRQQLDNLLESRGYTANVLGMFQREPGLGVVYPPMIHVGYPTMGNAWFTNFDAAEELMKQLDIRVPLDTSSPLAPYGGMFIARPEALAAMTAKEWQFDDYPDEGLYGDGTLSHVQERLVSYVAAENGYHTRTIANTGYAAISHSFLEYKLDQQVQGVSGYAIDQVHEMRPLVRVEEGGQLALIKYLLFRYHPWLATIGVWLTSPGRKNRLARRSQLELRRIGQ